MEILLFNRRTLAFLGFLPREPIFRYKFLHTIVSLIILLILFVFELMSAIYVVRHLQMGDIESSLQAGIQVTGAAQVIGSMFTMMYHKEKVQKVVDGFQKIFDQCTSKWTSGCQRNHDNSYYFLQPKIQAQHISFCKLTNSVKNSSSTYSAVQLFCCLLRYPRVLRFVVRLFTTFEMVTSRLRICICPSKLGKLKCRFSKKIKLLPNNSHYLTVIGKVRLSTKAPSRDGLVFTVWIWFLVVRTQWFT